MYKKIQVCVEWAKYVAFIRILLTKVKKKRANLKGFPPTKLYIVTLFGLIVTTVLDFYLSDRSRYFLISWLLVWSPILLGI